MFFKKENFYFFMLVFLSCEIYSAEVAKEWVPVRQVKISEEQAALDLQGIGDRHFGSLRTLFGHKARQAAADAAKEGRVHINLENPLDPRRDYKSVRVYQKGNQVRIRFIQNGREVLGRKLKDHSLFKPGAFDYDYPHIPATPVVCDENGDVHIYLQNAESEAASEVVKYTFRERVKE